VSGGVAGILSYQVWNRELGRTVDGQVGRLRRNQRQGLQQISRGEPTVGEAYNCNSVSCKGSNIRGGGHDLLSALWACRGGCARISRNEGADI